jgi:2-succinyl-5-enolpyruvyl-6-hydroxy-3-cyclohexene-1-carboxylate synthase
VDQFGQPKGQELSIYANRGASGIDGNISTGLGIASTSNQPTVILVGDITFYHDSNGLLALKKMSMEHVIIVLLNNNGGGIFQRLPIAQLEPPFEELFLTPHDLDFEPIAYMYGLTYQATNNISDFAGIFRSALGAKSSTVIEFRTDSYEDDELRRQIIEKVKSHLEVLLAEDGIETR